MTPLHHFGEFVRTLLLAVPLSAVRALFVVSLVIVLAWVLLMPASRTQPAGGAKRWDENLKLGTCIAIGIQILIYAFM